MIPDSHRSSYLMSISVIALLFLVVSCGDSGGRWSKYQSQKAFFKAQQAISRAELSISSGQSADREELASRLKGALVNFNGLEADLTEADSGLLIMASQAYLGLGRIYAESNNWSGAVELYKSLSEDSSLPDRYRNIGLMQLGRGYEARGQPNEAVSAFRELMVLFYPPESGSGVNREVLGLGVPS